MRLGRNNMIDTTVLTVSFSKYVKLLLGIIGKLLESTFSSSQAILFLAVSKFKERHFVWLLQVRMHSSSVITVIVWNAIPLRRIDLNSLKFAPDEYMQELAWSQSMVTKQMNIFISESALLETLQERELNFNKFIYFFVLVVDSYAPFTLQIKPA